MGSVSGPNVPKWEVDVSEIKNMHDVNLLVCLTKQLYISGGNLKTVASQSNESCQIVSALPAMRYCSCMIDVLNFEGMSSLIHTSHNIYTRVFNLFQVALLKESDEHPNVIRYFCTVSSFWKTKK